jgi:endonuclease I
MKTIIILTLILSSNPLQEKTLSHFGIDEAHKSNSISFSKSKKNLKSIYLQSNKNQTLYCSCSFDTNKQIDTNSCNYSPRINSNKCSQRLEFEHIVPAHALGKKLQCWEEPICIKKNGKKI